MSKMEPIPRSVRKKEDPQFLLIPLSLHAVYPIHLAYKNLFRNLKIIHINKGGKRGVEIRQGR